MNMKEDQPLPDKQVNFHQVIPDSHRWTDFKMLLNWVEQCMSHGKDRDYLIIGLKNSTEQTNKPQEDKPAAQKSEQLTPVDGWIDAETKPPYNKGVMVFIPDEDFHVTSGMWDRDNKWVLLDEYRVPECPVTHWRELPDIPEPHKSQQQEHFNLLKAIKYGNFNLLKAIKYGNFKR